MESLIRKILVIVIQSVAKELVHEIAQDVLARMKKRIETSETKWDDVLLPLIGALNDMLSAQEAKSPAKEVKKEARIVEEPDWAINRFSGGEK